MAQRRNSTSASSSSTCYRPSCGRKLSRSSTISSSSTFVEGRPDHRYLVRSLYWDDRHACPRSVTRSIRSWCAPVRIRTQHDRSGRACPRFLEIKGRNNNLVVKHRTPVDIGTESSQVAGDSLAELVMANAVEGPIQQEFSFQRYRRRIQPYCLIDYQRRPFVSRFDPEFRLTFDEELTATRTDRLFPKRTDRTVRVAPGYTVMEVKFRHHLPSWFHRIIQGYELRRLSFSKICEGTVALGLADED
ncbi:MAG: VTC domain-containing protein [Planctomycetota bacterium]